MADEATGATTAQTGWVARVLGVQMNHATSGATPTPLMPIWQRAREALDQQVSAMQRALRDYRDEDYDAIAEFGFNGLTGGRNTALMAALLEYDRAPNEAADARVIKAVDAYSEMLAPGSVLDDYDANPLGVAVSFRATLEQGLSGLRTALAGNRRAQS